LSGSIVGGRSKLVHVSVSYQFTPGTSHPTPDSKPFQVSVATFFH
jgi:hypothetical protein